MPKHLLIALLALGYTFTSSAQQQVPSTLFTSNYVNFNPAMSGIRYKSEANVQWRNQWTQTNGAPAILWANYTQRLDKIHGAAGIVYEYDYIGFTKTHTALANYAFHLQTKKMLWSFGVAAGMSTYRIPKEYFIPPTTLNDPSLPSTRTTVFQSNAGVALHTENLNVGLSVTQLAKTAVYQSDHTKTYTMVPHYNLHADYSFHFGEKWMVTPALYIFSDNVKTGSVTSIKATFNNKLWFGVSTWNLIPFYDSFETYGLMLGYDFKEKFRVGYSLEYNEFMSHENEPNLTHEIVLSYLLR